MRRRHRAEDRRVDRPPVPKGNPGDAAHGGPIIGRRIYTPPDVRHLRGRRARARRIIAAVVEEQLARLHHRGPDARGQFDGQRGPSRPEPPGDHRPRHRRSADHQRGPRRSPPSSTARSTTSASCATSCVARGHEFRSRGDTEVIAHLAEELAPVELARRLDGMFAFAVWDERRGRLVLGRDRLGKKPLYYWCSAAAGSSSAARSRRCSPIPAVPRRLDPGAIPAYLTFGYVPTPRTFFDGVRSLPPGHVLDLRARRRAGRSSATGSRRSPASTASPQLDVLARRGGRARSAALLEAAVRRRLVSDVPLGAFLSGGIDSSAVVGDHGRRSSTARSRRSRSASRTATASTSARTRAWPPSATRTDHHEFVVQPDAVDLVERLVWHHDQPFGDSSAIPTFLLSEVTARPRDRRAVGRRRRRAVRRLRALRRRAGGAALRGAARRSCSAASRARSACCRPEPARPRRRACSGSRGWRSAGCPTPTARGSATSRTPSATRCSTAAATTGRSRTTARSGAAPRARARSTGCSTSTCAPTCSTTCS